MSGVAAPEEELDRLGRLERPDDAAQDAEDARLLAARREVRRRRLGVEAAVAGPAPKPNFFAALSGMNVVTCPSKRKIDPCTTGFPMKTLASFTR